MCKDIVAWVCTLPAASVIWVAILTQGCGGCTLDILVATVVGIMLDSELQKNMTQYLFTVSIKYYLLFRHQAGTFIQSYLQ